MEFIKLECRLITERMGSTYCCVIMDNYCPRCPVITLCVTPNKPSPLSMLYNKGTIQKGTNICNTNTKH